MHVYYSAIDDTIAKSQLAIRHSRRLTENEATQPLALQYREDLSQSCTNCLDLAQQLRFEEEIKNHYESALSSIKNRLCSIDRTMDERREDIVLSKLGSIEKQHIDLENKLQASTLLRNNLLNKRNKLLEEQNKHLRTVCRGRLPRRCKSSFRTRNKKSN